MSGCFPYPAEGKAKAPSRRTGTDVEMEESEHSTPSHPSEAQQWDLVGGWGAVSSVNSSTLSLALCSQTEEFLGAGPLPLSLLCCPWLPRC